jgi:hypothetical protein
MGERSESMSVRSSVRPSHARPLGSLEYRQPRCPQLTVIGYSPGTDELQVIGHCRRSPYLRSRLSGMAAFTLP